jgi:ferric-dicitrate binding protein FerR (iron transport regulator)
MNYQGKNPKEGLEQAVASMRADQPTAEVVREAGANAWQHLSQELSATGAGIESIRGCSDVRALLPQYRNGQLTPARTLLVEDHLHECVDCRREAETGQRASAAALPWKRELPKATEGNFRWVMAVAAVLIAGISIYFVQDRFFSSPAGMRARVESFTGGIYRIGFNGSEQQLKTGDELQEGDRVRTASDSKAMLRLGDGSLVEMNERSQFAVNMHSKDTTIALDRGKIIVQAAKRKTGHLYVNAPDCRVSVTGTVFAVNSGIKGSRVSVIEGEVRVAEEGVNSVLHAGDQRSTNISVGAVPVKQEIAWSQNLDKHLALLAEFVHLENKLDAVKMPDLRYQSNLLPMLPASTILFASIPNLGDAVDQANKLFQQELQESAVLREWWDQAQSQKGAPKYNEVIEYVHDLSQYLGNEIVFSVSRDGHEAGPLVIAQVQRPGLRQFIEQEAAKHANPKHPNGVRVFDEKEIASAQQGSGHGLFLLVRQDFVAAAVDIATLQRINNVLSNSQGGGFAATPFGQRLAASYQQGAGLLFGANLQVMAAGHASTAARGEHHMNGLQDTGLADVQFLIAERKDIGGQVTNRAELTFTGPRHALASWLAAPAPIGGLEFVSKDASLASAFVAKNPGQMLDDVFNIASGSHPDAKTEIAKGEADLKISFHQDLADTLGGEMTFALDGPILPTPSWKAIIEVYNPGRLQTTIQQLVNDANDHIKNPDQKATLEQASANGLTHYTVRFSNGIKSVEVHYTFTDGYMILGPSRAIVMDAIAVRQNGNSLARSASFRSLLPQDQHADVSALVYQNLAPVIGPIAQQLSPSQLQSLQQLAAETKPSVVCAYGEPNAIRVSSASRFFGLDLNTLALSTLMRMAQPGGAQLRSQ